MYKIMLSANSNSSTSSFPTWTSFISFSWWITLARRAYTVLNKTGNSEYTYLVPDLKQKNFSFLLLIMMLAVGLSNMAFIMLRWDLSILTLLRIFCVCVWKGVEFCQILFCIYWDDHKIFILYFVNLVYHIDLWKWTILASLE